MISIQAANELCRYIKHNKVCFYTGISLVEVGENCKNKINGRSVEHLVNRGSKLYAELSEQEYIINRVNASALVNSNICYFNVAMKIDFLNAIDKAEIKQQFPDMEDMECRKNFKGYITSVIAKIRNKWFTEEELKKHGSSVKEIWWSDEVFALDNQNKTAILEKSIDYWKANLSV